MNVKSFNFFGRGRSLRIAITMACQMAFILYGYDQGVFSGIVGNEDFLETFGHPGSGLEGIIVSIYNLGCFSGCILSFFFSETTGRRLAMWIAMGFIIVGQNRICPLPLLVLIIWSLLTRSLLRSVLCFRRRRSACLISW